MDVQLEWAIARPGSKWRTLKKNRLRKIVIVLSLVLIKIENKQISGKEW